MGFMRLILVFLVAGMLVIAGCGGDSDSESGSSASDNAPTAQDDAPAPSEASASKPEGKSSGTEVEVGESEFGPMLFDTNGQAIYIFENDPKGETVCYDECAAEWPPVFTDGEPQAGKGVKKSLLGTVKRRDGKLQVTYGGKPLYFYAHEEPNEVRCHNVNLNGGMWWVVGPDGKRRP